MQYPGFRRVLSISQYFIIKQQWELQINMLSWKSEDGIFEVGLMGSTRPTERVRSCFGPWKDKQLFRALPDRLGQSCRPWKLRKRFPLAHIRSRIERNCKASAFGRHNKQRIRFSANSGEKVSVSQPESVSNISFTHYKDDMY